jgi:hypothetical protein
MIPLSCKEGATVNHIDKDGVSYIFKPKSGLLESEYFDITNMDVSKKQPIREYLQKEKEFFDKIVIKIDPHGKYIIPEGKYSEFYTSRERGEVVGYWHIANSISDEEKKS